MKAYEEIIHNNKTHPMSLSQTGAIGCAEKKQENYTVFNKTLDALRDELNALFYTRESIALTLERITGESFPVNDEQVPCGERPTGALGDLANLIERLRRERTHLNFAAESLVKIF
jgi:hypothetical protein